MVYPQIAQIVGRKVLHHRSPGWKVDAMEEIFLLDDVYPYAHEVRAWSVLLTKWYTELAELPPWLGSANKDLVQQNYEAMLKESGYKIFQISQMDTVLWQGKQNYWYVFPCLPVPSEQWVPGERYVFRLHLPMCLRDDLEPGSGRIPD